jgi:hypothetical protein
LQRPLTFLLVAILSGSALAYVHGWRIVEFWHTANWEDAVFFQYTSGQIHSLVDCIRDKGPWPGLYRPLTTNLYYYLGGLALGNRVEAYHFVNLVFLIINALLLYRLALFFLEPWWAIIAPILSISRVALVQVVLFTTEFQGLLYVFFTILSVNLFISSRKSESTRMLTLSAISFCLALFSKEAALVLPALLILYGRLFDDRPTVGPYLLHPLLAVSWLMLFFFVLRPLYGNQPTGFAYDLSLSNLLRNYATYLFGFSNWTMSSMEYYAIPGVIPLGLATFAGTWYIRLFSSLLILLELALFFSPKHLKNQNLRVIAFGFGWFLITTFPFVIFENRLFMRYSYLGHVGLALCAAALAKTAIQIFFTQRATAPA